MVMDKLILVNAELHTLLSVVPTATATTVSSFLLLLLPYTKFTCSQRSSSTGQQFERVSQGM
jgi:hypothetical protein